MKKNLVAMTSLLFLNPACTVKTVFYDVNPGYESHNFNKETIAIGPFNGMWKIQGNDTMFERAPDYYPYAEAVAQEVVKKRKCLNVVQPDVVAQKVPEIESLLFKHKHAYQRIDSSDTSTFASLHTALDADYLLFFESIFFTNEQSAGNDTIGPTNTSTLVFQVWDLKNRQFMYRGESKGSGEGSKGGRVGKDSRSGKWCIQNTAYELVRSLPVCK